MVDTIYCDSETGINYVYKCEYVEGKILFESEDKVFECTKEDFSKALLTGKLVKLGKV